MELCPCSADIGDCNRCGNKYPKETMSGLPPRHKKVSSQHMYAEFDKVYAKEGDTERAVNLFTKAKADEEEHKEFVETGQRKEAISKHGVGSKESRNQKLVVEPLTLNKGGRKTRRNTTSGGDIVSHLLTIRNQVKLYHWQTGSFARHKATDDLTAALDTNIDEFVESYMGRYGRPKVSGSIKLHNFSESAARSFVAQQTKYLSVDLPKRIKSTDTDLLNLRDTILGDLNKVLYLFTLK